MKAHELTIAAKRPGKRVGRGIAAGGGKTAGRGTKGQLARTGKKIKLGFEGGQTKLSARLPKARGFTSKTQRHFPTEVVNISDLARIKATKIDNAALFAAGLTRDERWPVKLLASGNLDRAVTVRLAAVSKAAKTKIVNAGGSIELNTAVAIASKPVTGNNKKQSTTAKTASKTASTTTTN